MEKCGGKMDKKFGGTEKILQQSAHLQIESDSISLTYHAIHLDQERLRFSLTC